MGVRQPLWVFRHPQLNTILHLWGAKHSLAPPLIVFGPWVASLADPAAGFRGGGKLGAGSLTYGRVKWGKVSHLFFL